MVYPFTRLYFINEEVGYGLFATQFIPKGTIMYVKDSLELQIPPETYGNHLPELQYLIEKYTYRDENGIHILSWDFAKYVNHCCHPNTLSTAYGFDIAVKDIEKYTEITCDYGCLNVERDMPLSCSQPNCRMTLKPSDFELYYQQWDESIKAALYCFPNVEQPLLPLVEDSQIVQLLAFLKNSVSYKSVYLLRYHSKMGFSPKEANGI